MSKMDKTINLGFGVELEVLDTSYAKSFELKNNEAKMSQMLGMKLK